MLKQEFDYTLIEELEEKEKFPAFPLPVSIIKAEGSCLYDNQNKKYLDLTSNKDNNPFGYSNFNDKNENCFIDSGLFNANLAEKIEENIKAATGFSKAYFSSNKEDLYSLTKKLINIHLNKTQKDKILISSISVNKNLYTIKDVNCDLIPVNSETLLKTTFSKSVGALIIQIPQISNDITVPEDEYLREARALCDRNNALLVFDSAEIAPLRLNKSLFNYNNEIKPDIIISYNGLSNGFPFGTVICSEKVPIPDDFKTKSGVFSQAYSSAQWLIENCQETQKNIDFITEYLNSKLFELSETHISLVDYYSTGMLYTLVTDISAYQFAKVAFNDGIILDTINDNKIILSPPYNIKTDEIDYFIGIFDKIFDKLAEFDRLH